MKRKILLLLIANLFFLGLFLFIKLKPTYAFNCSLLSPVSVTTQSTSVTFGINGGGNFARGSYWVELSNNNLCAAGVRYCRPGATTQANSSGDLNPVTFNFPQLSAGKITATVYNNSSHGITYCSLDVPVSNATSGGGTCQIVPVQPNPFDPKPSNYVSFKITGQEATSGSSNDMLDTFLKTDNNNGSVVWSGCVKRSLWTEGGGFGFGYLSSGTYYVQVNQQCNPQVPILGPIGESPACYATFYVNPSGGGLTSNGNPQNPAPPGPCANGANVGGKCTVVDTALGPIGTDPASLIESLFGIILSLSGGIALLLIIVSGYRLMTSQGNPEGIKNAREQLTSAVVGLLFIIFAIVILQIIGVNILHIPGFAAGGGGGSAGTRLQ